jgi:hypothetical protein
VESNIWVPPEREQPPSLLSVKDGLMELIICAPVELKMQRLNKMSGERG